MKALHRVVFGGLLATSAGAAAAQETPANDSAATAEDAPALSLDTVIVREVAPDATTRIDRQTYEVQHDPQVDTASALEILGKVPSVSVSATGRVLLLGQPSVSVTIDGREVGWNDQTLSLLPASQIARIEVMTNPSAEFQAQSGGIINIVTKRERDAGLGGQLTLDADTFGGRKISLSPSWGHGNLSVNGTFEYRDFTNPSDSTRVTTALGADAPVATRQTSHFEDGGEPVSARLQASLKLDERSTLSMTLSSFLSNHLTTNRIHVLSGSDAWFERTDAPSDGWFHDGQLTYTHKGRIDGEELTLDASAMAIHSDSTTSITDLFDTPDRDPSVYERTDMSRYRNAEFTADYKRPVGALGKLSVGAGWNGTDEDQREASMSLGGGNRIPDAAYRHKGGRDIASLYTTFEFSRGDWTFLPGLRVEDERLHVDGEAGFRHGRTDWFPSLHVSRDLFEGTRLALSATRRIERPSFGNLDPAVTYRTTTEASAGNPGLQPGILTNYEARLTWKRDTRTLTATVYDHESDLGRDQAIVVIDGNVRLSTQVNVEGGSDRGAEVSLTAPLAPRWQYTATANLFEEETTRLDEGVGRRDTNLTYTGKVKLEYGRKNARGDFVDQGEFLLNYQGPRQYLQSKSSAYLKADLTWRRTLTPEIVLSLTVSDLFGSAGTTRRIYGEGFTDVTTYDSQGPSFRIALTRKFGRPPE